MSGWLTPGVKGRAPSVYVLLLWASVAVILLSIPKFSSDSTLNLMIIIFFYCVVAQSWNLLAGFTGQFSMGHQAFIAIGAYATGLMSEYLGTSPLLGIVCAAIASTLVGLFLAAAVMRLSGSYLAMATWALGMTLQVVLMATYEFTRGDRGLVVPSLLGQLGNLTPYYYIFLAFSSVSLAIMYLMLNSRLGIQMRAVRDDQVRARSLGVNSTRIKTLAFAVSSFFCGLAGAFYAHYTAIISPSLADFTNMGMIIAMVMIGGMGKFMGPIVGAAIVVYTNTKLQAYGQLNVVLYSLTMILIIRFYRDGLLAGAQGLISFVRERYLVHRS